MFDHAEDPAFPIPPQRLGGAARRRNGTVPAAGCAGNHLTYSPYVLPVVIDGVRGVVVDLRLRDLEPLAYKFVVDFARDNNLKTEEREI
ncbi:hypothetical protein G6F57_022914 [Rhizopus arrhizus]|nr:hypothetical protein G6F57_022914 [Rhizopus arrhizus]